MQAAKQEHRVGMAVWPLSPHLRSSFLWQLRVWRQLKTLQSFLIMCNEKRDRLFQVSFEKGKVNLSLLGERGELGCFVLLKNLIPTIGCL